MNPDDLRSQLLPVVVDLTNTPPLRPFEVNELLILDDRLEARFINYKVGLRSFAMVYVTNAVQPHLTEVQVTRLKRREPVPPVRVPERVREAFLRTDREPVRVRRNEPQFEVNRLQAEALNLGVDLSEVIVEAFGLTPDMMGPPDRNPRPESIRFQVNLEGLEAAGIDIERLRTPPGEEKVEVAVVKEFSRKVEL